jgi:hypothetical protein
VNELPITPYKGLMPYAQEDAPFFFGREAEREIVTANLMASRLTVLYGSSGVGKSSVLSAGVAYHLRQLAEQNLKDYGTPEFAVVVFRSWRDAPLSFLTDAIRAAVTELLGADESGPSLPSLSFGEALHTWAERAGGELYVILDQFEEYFLYHPQQESEGTFAVEFPRAVNRPDLRVNFLLSLREDALASLDRFKGRIPGLFDNILRIEHLDREAAREAIVRPIEQYNRLLVGQDQQARQVEIEPALVEAVLAQVQTGQVVIGQAGRGVVATSLGQQAGETLVETPYLQMVLNRVWDEEMRAKSRTLRLVTLERLGGASKIVRTHLDTVMRHLSRPQRAAAARIFHHLVTPSGTKIAHAAGDLATYTERKPEQVQPVLQRLAAPDIRLLRPVSAGAERGGETLYEIYHDILGSAILEWRERYDRARRRRMGLIMAGVIVAVIIGGLLAAQSFSEGVGRIWIGVVMCSIPWTAFLLLGFALGRRWRPEG